MKENDVEVVLNKEELRDDSSQNFHHCVADIKGYYEDIDGGLDNGD